MNEASKLACVGLDCHRNFSLASARDEAGGIAWRQRLNHADRAALKQAKLDPHLSSGRKVAGWRAA